ncbi:MAG: LamB/YcsF family protein [Myxococcaceae bacterium]|nr:LamB/YcsF family protein [Myxococcaceae bacterium]MCI0669263.1 LamB/YcsF family protein [Myxococcaceae bacterium]
MRRVDLNCDMGESFGAWRMGDDEAVLPHVTSVSIACGFHAGDPSVMLRTVRAAAERGVAIGAHPGLPDLVGFGRRRMSVSPDEAYALVVYQVGALLGFTRAVGTRLAHVKPHGALYNMAAADTALAAAIARAVRDVDSGLVLFGLAGSALITEAERAGLRVASEVFPDRGYEADGSLASRGKPGALVTDPEEAARRAVRMVVEGKVAASDGRDVTVRADTLCVHGDGPHAADIARLLRQRLQEAGVQVLAPGG